MGRLKKKPNSITELRSLLGLVEYFRRAILNFSQIARPLYNILKNSDLTSRSKQSINWTEEHQSRLDNLLIHVTSPPILAFPDFQLPFILHTDALAKGLGCALYQIQENQLRVLGYRSRKIVAAENKYHNSKLEFLAIKWAIYKHFRDYFYYSTHFDVYIDFNPMTYLFTSAKVNATRQRWVNELSNFNFSIHYKPGIESVVADSLSRYPRLQECNLEQYSQHLNPVKSAFDAVVNQVRNNEAWVAAVNTVNTVFSDNENQILYDVGDQKTTLASQDLAKYQAEEPWIHLVDQFKKKGEYPDNHVYKQLPEESKILLQEWDNLWVHEDILYRQKQQQPRQLILPSKLKPLVYNELHVNMGHLGTD